MILHSLRLIVRRDDLINFIFSEERASSNIANALIGRLGFEEIEKLNNMRQWQAGKMRMLQVSCRIIDAEFLDGAVDGPMVFLSRHSSAKGIPSFTVHPMGNWKRDAELGGRPNQLSTANPQMMLDFLCAIKSLNRTGMEVTYEATHHGPYVGNPSFFVELGGNEDAIADAGHAAALAYAISDGLERKTEFGKVAVGIGGMHYPQKFTRLALEGKYAFSHIMPKHSIVPGMLGQAIERSAPEAEIAVVEWKSIKATDREAIVRELGSLGMGYEKV